MYFVYQTHDIVRGRRKRGKMLDKPIIHIMGGEKTVCGITPQDMRLMRLADEQIRAWLFSQDNSKSFNAVMCYTCLFWTDTRPKQRGNEGVSEMAQEVVETLGGKLLP
jgi:hypothetical protein